MNETATPGVVERLLFDTAVIGVQEVLMLGRYHYTAAHPPLAAHCHEDVLEVCYLERGRQMYAFGERDIHGLRGGEVLAIQPGEVHGTGQFPEFPRQLYWLQLRWPAPGRRLLGLGRDETNRLLAALRELPRQFTTSPQLRPQFEALLSPAVALSKELIRTRFRVGVLQLLITCIENAGAGRRTALPQVFTRALRLLSDDWSGRITVAQLAKSARMSESYFKQQFRRTMGVPPAEFIRVLRLERAQMQLRTTHRPVTEVALANGFASSQRFAGAFRRHFGCSPRAYRRRKSEGKVTAPAAHGAGVGFHPVVEDSST